MKIEYRKTRLTEKQKIQIGKEYEKGTLVKDISKKLTVSVDTVYRILRQLRKSSYETRTT